MSAESENMAENLQSAQVGRVTAEMPDEANLPIGVEEVLNSLPKGRRLVIAGRNAKSGLLVKILERVAAECSGTRVTQGPDETLVADLDGADPNDRVLDMEKLMREIDGMGMSVPSTLTLTSTSNPDPDPIFDMWELANLKMGREDRQQKAARKAVDLGLSAIRHQQQFEYKGRRRWIVFFAWTPKTLEQAIGVLEDAEEWHLYLTAAEAKQAYGAVATCKALDSFSMKPVESEDRFDKDVDGLLLKLRKLETENG